MNRARARSARRALTITACAVAGLTVAAGVHAAFAVPAPPATAIVNAAGMAGAPVSQAPGPGSPVYSCGPGGRAAGQGVYGAFGDASVIGWAGNSQAVVACLGGSFFVLSRSGPGSGSAPVTGTTYGYGI